MPDLHIEPSLDQIANLLATYAPERVLVIGDPAPAVEELLFSFDTDVRWTDNPRGARLPAHVFAFRGHADNQWTLVVNLLGTPLLESKKVDWEELSYSDPLDPVPERVEKLWLDGQARKGMAAYGAGDTVRIGQGAIGRVKSARRVDDGYEYSVEVEGVVRQVREASLTVIAGDPRQPEFWLQQAPADAQSIALTLTWTKLSNPLTDTIYSFRSSRTLFRTYQFRPVMKMINSDSRRLLIADEVGIGKTIEAGLIWNELEQRGDVESVLVVVPSNLRFKWQEELRNRFDRRVPILKRDDIREWIVDLRRGESTPIQGIVTLETLRTAKDILEELELLMPRIDLVIVDEAHNLRNTGTKSHHLGALLSEWSDALVFLSATPLNLRESDLFNLLHLLDENAYPSEQTLKMQIEPNQQINQAARQLLGSGKIEPRRVLKELESIEETEFGALLVETPDFESLEEILDQDGPLSVKEVSKAKRLLLDLHTLAPIFTRTRKIDTTEHKATREARNIDVEWTPAERAYYDAIYKTYQQKAARSGGPAAFIMQMPLRQAASCLPAMQEILAKKQALGWSDELDSEFVGESIEGLLVDFADQPTEVLKRPLIVDSKFDAFETALHEALKVGSGQAMIFSFFRGTLEYLQRRLSGSFSVGLMYGPTPSEERQRLIADFKANKFDILLCSEVGSEGLDFQFCNVLVNYDLPWNPMRVEQRIGRLDRFGQENDKIFIFNMQIPGTIETDILGRLYDRIGVFKRTIGDLEPILRELDAEIENSLDPNLTSAQREDRRLEIEVAIASHEQDKENLSTTESLVAGLDSLLVDGFEEDSPGGGRFVGQEEIRRFVEQYLKIVSARAKNVRGYENAVTISGEGELPRELRKVRKKGGTLSSPAQLAAAAEGPGFTVTFDQAEAVSKQLDFMGVRHPLIGIAAERFAADALTLSRFGALSINDSNIGGEQLVALYLVTSEGVRPSLEILATAVDAHGDVVEGTGELLLTALSHGRISTAPSPVSIDVPQLFEAADRHRATLMGVLERQGQQANGSLVDRRAAILKTEYATKIANASLRLSNAINQGSNARYTQGLTTRVANLRSRRDEAIAALEQKRQYTIFSEPIAVVVVQP